MKSLLLVCCCVLFIAACKKNVNSTTHSSNQLFPLTVGNEWIYVDSFFDIDGFFYGYDTFYLKPAKAVNQNNRIYTPITDQYDEAIFTVRSDDTSVFMLEPPGESLVYKSSLIAGQPLNNSYYGDSLKSTIYTEKIDSTSFPSYKIIITQDDGFWGDYKQQEFYFTIGLGIIRGRDRWKTSNGDIYMSDSYRLISYTIN